MTSRNTNRLYRPTRTCGISPVAVLAYTQLLGTDNTPASSSTVSKCPLGRFPTFSFNSVHPILLESSS